MMKRRRPLWSAILLLAAYVPLLWYEWEKTIVLGERGSAFKEVKRRPFSEGFGNRTPGAITLSRGDVVTVREPFFADIQDGGVALKPGDQGLVLGVDNEGDAEVIFDDHGRVWIWTDHFFQLAKYSAPHLSAGPELVAKNRECREQGANLGAVESAEECRRLVAAAAEGGCGDYFMFSRVAPLWGCRCCALDNWVGGPFSNQFDVYKGATEVHRVFRWNADASYRPVFFKRFQECSVQAVDFGQIMEISECDRRSGAAEECGEQFMFSRAHPEWSCRCCAPDGGDFGPGEKNWDTFQIQIWPSKGKMRRRPLPLDDLAVMFPLEPGPRPPWLIKDDVLVIDARPAGRRGGGVLILQTILCDSRSQWGSRGKARPRWLRAILSTNKAHARRYGHAMVLRTVPTMPIVTGWQLERCGLMDEKSCAVLNERENYNWEKHLMMRQYLESPELFSHVLTLDADAALIRPEHNSLEDVGQILERNATDVFLTDEDWLEYGAGRINGGLMFSKNTNFTRNLFRDTFDAHQAGPKSLKEWRIGLQDRQCSSNEQICLNDLWAGFGKEIFRKKVTLASGNKWNHGAEVGGFDDPAVEVLHFMGSSKFSAGVVLCDGLRNVTLEPRDGFGCHS